MGCEVPPASVRPTPEPAATVDTLAQLGNDDASERRAAEFEQRHVHKVYDQIAVSFSRTRYKAWPVVSEFVRSRPAGALGADVGCGNGKNMAVDSHRGRFVVGIDMCAGLLKFAQQAGPGGAHDCVRASNLALPLRSGALDHVVSIAVLHHFSTLHRRVAAMRELLRVLRPGGVALVFVWALEQDPTSKRRFERQDELVEFIVAPHNPKPDPNPRKGGVAPGSPFPGGPAAAPPPDASPAAQRFYHLFRRGELEALVAATGLGEITRAGYDKSNWFCTVLRNSVSA